MSSSFPSPILLDVREWLIILCEKMHGCRRRKTDFIFTFIQELMTRKEGTQALENFVLLLVLRLLRVAMMVVTVVSAQPRHLPTHMRKTIYDNPLTVKNSQRLTVPPRIGSREGATNRYRM